MAPRSQVTARHARLGAELRKLRVAAGLSAREVAVTLGSTSAQMSQVEAGLSGISEQRLRRLAELYGCQNPALIDALAAMATERTRGWWEKYRGLLLPEFLDLAELEHHAVSLRVIATAHVPGLLQTEDYARAVFGYWVPQPAEAVLAAQVEHRMARKQVLAEGKATEYEAVVHEAVLRTRVADRRTALAQLDELMRQSERPNITVKVIPFDRDGFAGASAALMYAGGVVPELDTVQRDTPYGTAFLDDATQLAAMRTLFRKVEAASLDSAKSRDFMRRIAKEL
ncbi:MULTISPECIES: helix-turn-helix domain-containing protein [Streptomyces]|uniref:Helix-turn-helix transcriptional regulator n=1 Tax=Streptomyces griseoaurantiacus TaxID=68213 RepID=A0A7W2DWS8_9ACTN|nr:MULTISPECIES: helix-turn-helix transcriptional regulator [Streptomyces]MBA5224446.1 helix-turn-helix transcriptional regulator [Streptomyces griseoaurantiacus]MCF0088056.1 hypothetical protein [Streptomyces sp. MH192]MCF0099587.1 hypothetical protein [Streptomyces sp. MH191]